MKFIKTKLEGAYIVEPEKFEDHRGFFARLWCKDEFKKNGLNQNLVQISIAYNFKKYTLRGMHFQKKPFEEAKLVRCSKGSIYDVIVDLRPESKTFKEWISVEISDKNFKMIYVPEGFAHGYQTLTDDAEVIYHMSESFVPDSYSGVRWNDKAFNIKWPFPEEAIMSDKDIKYIDF